MNNKENLKKIKTFDDLFNAFGLNDDSKENLDKKEDKKEETKETTKTKPRRISKKSVEKKPILNQKSLVDIIVEENKAEIKIKAKKGKKLGKNVVEKTLEPILDKNYEKLSEGFFLDVFDYTFERSLARAMKLPSYWDTSQKQCELGVGLRYIKHSGLVDFEKFSKKLKEVGKMDEVEK